MALTMALLSPIDAAWAQTGPAIGVTTQLPRHVVPSHYAIRIDPDAEHLTFAGSVVIDVNVAQASSNITLNAADLAFGEITLTRAGEGQGVKAKAVMATPSQTAVIIFARPISPGAYQLKIDYTGVISTQANGLFALDYQDGAGASKRALFTQMEAPDARRVVPSFDEPSYKATFDLSVVVPANQMAVGNMPVKSSAPLGRGKTLVTFGTTPKMSSYLLFMGLGELDRATKMSGATEIGVVTGRGNTAKAQLALDAAVDILKQYNEYFGTPYPLPKLDNVAGPGQSQFFSAMENWGAIFTFERALLVDPKSTSEATRRRVFEVVAHEMAHQWFGDLVTMAWWDDLWLNEGFASWMATKVSDRLKPEWEILLTRVDGREAAMSLDAFSTTHPVVQKIHTVEEVNQAFDAITYEKGEAVIAMLEGFAGADVWRDGIRAYMKAHAYGNTQTDDLWAAVEGAGAKGLTTIAHDFTSQPGIPLVRVDSATCANGQTRLVLSQSEFSRDNKAAKDQTPLRWHVPVRAQVLGGEAGSIVLDGKGTLDLPGCGAYVINAGQSGYFRSLYPAANMSALAQNFSKLPSIDQLGLLADNWQLAQGNYQPIDGALDLVNAVGATASDAVLQSLPDYMTASYKMFDGDSTAQTKIGAFASRKLTPILTRIGYDTKPGEGPQVPLLRQNLIAALGEMGDATVVTEAKRRFALLAFNPSALDGPLKFVWLRIVAHNADKPTWDALHTLAKKALNQLEQSQYFALLGLAKDDDLARQALDLAMTDEPGKTTSAAIISAAGKDHDMMAVDYVLAHRSQYEAMIDVSARSQALARLGG
ncbi:MAG: M1 family metallopeptidase, partial [Sphingobium sp.]